MLEEYGYHPRVHDDTPHVLLYFPHAHWMAPKAPPLQRPLARTTSAHSRSASSSVSGRTRSAAPPFVGVVVHDNQRCTASAPTRRTSGHLSNAGASRRRTPIAQHRLPRRKGDGGRWKRRLRRPSVATMTRNSRGRTSSSVAPSTRTTGR
jgi:hypothetical protein